MKVYVLESSDEWGENHKLEGVFSSEEKALVALKMFSGSEAICPSDLSIECMELDEVTIPVGRPGTPKTVAI